MGKDDTEYFSSGERIPNELVDFKYLVTKQIAVCQNQITIACTKIDLERTKSALNVLKVMILSTLSENQIGEGKKKLRSDSYLGRYKKIFEKHEKIKKSMSKGELEAKQVELEKNFLLDHFFLLLTVSSESGLTHMRSIIEEI